MTAGTAAAPADAFVVFGKPEICAAEIAEVVDSLETAWLGTGPKVKSFERSVAEYMGAEHAIATNSCTAALHLSLLSLGVGPGDQVIVPTMTFCATANIVLHTGARPVLVDIDSESQCITPETVEPAITPRTRAIMPVHFAGRPAPMPALRALADRHGLSIVQDAAHCIEGRIDGRAPADWGDTACLSFYATKNVVTGEGGMVITDDPELAERMRVLGLHGIDADAWKRFGSDGYRHYECVAPGFKYNMMDLQAALGIHQLARIHENLRQRERQWARYDNALAGLPLDLPEDVPENVRHSRHLYTVLVRDAAPVARDALMLALREDGIGTGIHYRPVHEHQFYREAFGYRPEAFPVAHEIGAHTLSLPLGPALSVGEQERVIEALRARLAP